MAIDGCPVETLVGFCSGGCEWMATQAACTETALPDSLVAKHGETLAAYGITEMPHAAMLRDAPPADCGDDGGCEPPANE